MKLTRSQKKFLKKNLKKLSLSEIAQRLDVGEEEFKAYLKSIWPKEKYQKFLSPQPVGLEKTGLRKNWLALGILAFLAVAVYLNSLGNDFVADDIPAILENENLGNLSYYLFNQPLNLPRYFLYFLSLKIGGLNPLFYRIYGLVFHLGSVLTIYALISLLHTSSLAFIVASLFAVHPILSEAVVWVSGGVYPQYSFFLLLSLLFYFMSKSRDWSKKYYLASAAIFLLALLTTEKAAILPLIILSFEISTGQVKKIWKKTIPFFTLSGVWVLFVLASGFLGQRVSALQSEYYLEEGMYNPLTQIPVAIASYLQLTIWPDKLTLYHSEMSFSQGQYVVMLLTTLGFLGVLIYTLIKKKYHSYFFWLSFFVITLLPTLTPFKIAWIVAERYTYLGMLGLLVVIGFGLQKVGDAIKNTKIAYALLGFLLLTLSARTVVRNRDWKNSDTLWQATAKTSPSSAQNHNNLGDMYARQGDFEKSIEEFKKAIELKADYAGAYHNMANSYREMGIIDQAMENYEKAISLKPDLWQSYQNLTAIYIDRGQLDLAEESIKKAIEIDPENAGLHYNLGIVYLKLEDAPRAQEEFLKARELDPQIQLPDH